MEFCGHDTYFLLDRDNVIDFPFLSINQRLNTGTSKI